jgi:DNA recombination protein Rad52
MTVFKPEQISELSAPLDRSYVRERSQSNRTFSYIEGWHAIAEANRIFGFDGWDRNVLEYKCVSEKQRKIGRDGRDGWAVSYIVHCRVRVSSVIRDGMGSGHGIDQDLGLAHESAIKEAETDAMKRALMTFGNPFGLALYDKDQKNVADIVKINMEQHEDPAVVMGSMISFIKQAKTKEALRKYWKQMSGFLAANGITQGTDEYEELMQEIQTQLEIING